MMASKRKIKNKKTPLYEVTDSNEIKISIKASDTETDTSSFKIKNSEENKENLCEVTSHDETNKKTSKKKKHRQKNTCDKANESEISSGKKCYDQKANCEASEPSNEASEPSNEASEPSNEASKKKIEDPKVSIYEIRKSDEEGFELKVLSAVDITKIKNGSIPPPKADIKDYDENEVLDKNVTVYDIVSKPGIDKDEIYAKITCTKTNKNEVSIEEKFLYEETISDKANKSEVAVKEKSLHDKITSDKANESAVIVEEKSFDEEDIFNAQNNICPFTIKDDILIGVKDKIYNLHIGNLILQAFKAEPRFIGQMDALTGEQTTFQQMKENSVKCALWLKTIFKNRKTYSRRVITICTINPINAYIPYLATLYLGARANPWNEQYFENDVRVLYFLEENMPDVIFIDDHNASSLQKAIKTLKENQLKNLNINPTIVVFDEIEGFYSLKKILAAEVNEKVIDEFSCETHNPFNTAVVMYSSNTVNYPGNTHIPYIAFVSPSNLEVPLMTYGEIGLWYGCLCWTHSLFLTVRAIISFTTALKIPKFLFDEERLYEIIEKCKVTWIFLDSSLCEKMHLTDIMVTRYNVSCLKQFLFGDLPIDEGIHEDFIFYLPDTSVTQVYCDSTAGVIAFQRDSGSLRSCGYVSKNVKVAIIDMDTRKVVGVNKHGEIWCKTPYMYGPPLTLQKIDPKMDNQFNDWYYTGDFGYYDDNGEIYIVDKVRHLIRYRNSIVVAAEIEEMLLRNWNVVEAVVLPIPVANDGQYPAAFVRTILEAQVTENELIEYIEKTMADSYKLRGGVYFVKNPFKCLPNGKIDRSRIKFQAGW